MTALLVVLGAAVGAPLRYATDLVLAARLGRRFPWGTLAVNVVGSFVLGWVVAAVTSPEVLALVGTGFCGALTTYSTFGHDTVALAGDGRRGAAGAYVAASLVGGLAAAAAGLALGGLMSGSL